MTRERFSATLLKWTWTGVVGILEAIRYVIEQLLYLLSIGILRFAFCDLKHRKSSQLEVTFPYSFQVQKEFIIVPSAQLHISELLWAKD